MRKLCAGVLLCAVLVSFPLSGSAQRAPDHLKDRAEFETRDGIPPRARLEIGDRAPSGPAAMRFRAWVKATGGSWQVKWDQDTQVPLRIFGTGIAAPGTIESGAAAQTFSRDMLARSLPLLAPGASPSDFVLAANHLGDGIRTVSFRQTYDGLPVLGGQVSFRFKNDRLIVLASEAYPNVKVAVTPAPVQARVHAEQWIGESFAPARIASRPGSPVILPIVRTGGVSYHRVDTVIVDTEAPLGRWDVYVDPKSGNAIARSQRLRFAKGQLYYNAPERWPGGGRKDYPVAHATAGAMTTSAAGELIWDGGGTFNGNVGASGPYARVKNEAGTAASKALDLFDGAIFTWLPGGEFEDAQFTTFIHVQLAKAFARTLNPKLAWLDQQIPITVNINDSCNAWSDGNSINFFRANSECGNTGQLADVIYHEFGHSLHNQSIIPGAGAFDGAFSEGLSDYLAATMVNDPAMGRGFFLNATPLRHIDPVGREYAWPADVGEVHDTGRIFSGAMWDLRKSLVTRYGHADGARFSDRLFYAAVQRAASIPATYAEVLAADDDDGNLENGTPNGCAIRYHFSRHGLAEPFDIVAGTIVPQRKGLEIFVPDPKLEALECGLPKVTESRLEWRIRGSGTSEVISMQPIEGGFLASLPNPAPNQVLEYRIHVLYDIGAEDILPDNAADPYYQVFVGNLVPLACHDFEQDPLAQGWSQNGNWQWGTPDGAGGDPALPYAGSAVFGNQLHGAGTYAPNQTAFAKMPALDVGDAQKLHLQFRRWLTVEDAEYDQASIRANGMLLWQNRNGADGAVNHRDLEWVFKDVDLGSALGQGPLELSFELKSDGGLELGGWTLDDVCVVAEVEGPCDPATGCQCAHCSNGTCGNMVVDNGEACDDGNGQDGDGCTSLCELEGTPGGGGCMTGSGAGLWFTLLLLARARRRGARSRCKSERSSCRHFP